MPVEHQERLSAVRGFPSQTSHTLSALSGGAFVILIVVSFLLDLDRPHFDDSPARFASYYNDNQSQLQISMLLAAFSTFWLAWFFGVLRWLYEGAEKTARGFVRAGPIAFAGGVTGVAVAAAAGVAQLTAVEVAGTVPASILRALDLMNAYGILWAEVLLSVHLLSAFFVIRVTQVLPQWIGITAIVGAVLGFFQAVLVLAPGQDDNIFGIVGQIWFLLFLVYVFFTSLSVARRAETALLAG